MDNFDTKEDLIKLIRTFPINLGDITEVKSLKKGMTNRSFLVTGEDGKYIVRIPGEGTDKLINRQREAMVYQAVAGKGLADDIVYIDPASGYKITRFWENARCCDLTNDRDVARCMDKLRAFHKLEMVVDHEFNIYDQIDFYESLWGGKSSAFADYRRTKEQLYSLKPFIETHIEKKILTHIDAVPDNFLFISNEKGEEEIRLIDWEYAGMQDPHVDLAMFCIYSLYDRTQVDALIDAYFEGNCQREIRIKIYCYISICGLLWSNWCEYKHSLGVTFGDYAIRQYGYASEYYKIAHDEFGYLR